MKLFNRIIGCVSACVIAIGGASLSAYAENIADDRTFGSDYAIVDLEQYQEYLDSLTDEQRKKISDKEQMFANFENEIFDGTYATSTTATLVGLPGTFTIYQQETDTYSVPACVKSALMYINGSSPTQSSISSVIGTYFTEIPSYLNNHQDITPYILVKEPTQKNLTNYIKYDITSNAVPIFLKISGTTELDWYYRTDGHCVISNGIYDDASRILIADPNGNRVAGCPYFYEKQASIVTNFTSYVSF